MTDPIILNDHIELLNIQKQIEEKEAQQLVDLETWETTSLELEALIGE